MSKLREIKEQKPRLLGLFLWILSIAIAIACFMYQDKTGPTYPLEGIIGTGLGEVSYTFLRSEIIGTDLKIMFLDPIPEGISGSVRYRRYKSNDEWATMPMTEGTFEFTRRGSTESVQGMGAELPSLQVRAGKYEFYVFIDDGAEKPTSITGDQPIYARYKAEVPGWVLLLHILVIFVSMTLAVRTTLEALFDGSFKWMIKATILTLLFGAFVLGPLVQWYAFGVLWSGIPFGYDWTDNKVLLELLFWLVAAYMNRGGLRNPKSVYLAGVMTFLVYFIPHSIFGSEYDYTTGKGHGTAG